MPGEEEARVGLSSAQLATTALTTTSGGSVTSSASPSAAVAGTTSSSSSSLTALPKASLPSLAQSAGNGGGAGSRLLTSSRGATTYNSGNTPLTTTTLTPIAIASCPPNSITVPSANNNLPGATTTTTTAVPNTGVHLNNSGLFDGAVLGNNKKSFQQNNPLPGAASISARPNAPSIGNLNNVSGSGASLGLESAFNQSKQAQQQQQHQPLLHYHQYQQQPPLSLKPIIATPNGNPSSASAAETNYRDTGTCNGHGHHSGAGGSSHRDASLVDDDEIDEAGDSSKLELQLQFAGIDKETVVDVDVEDEEENNCFDAGIESGPMCSVVPTSQRNGNGGGGGSGGAGGSGSGAHPSSSLPGGEGSGGGTQVVAPSGTAAGSAAPATSTTSSSGGAGGATTGPTSSMAAAATTSTTGGSGVGGAGSRVTEEEDEEEDVQEGKTVECTEVVVPDHTIAEKCLFYTTAFFILLAVFSLFAFLFLVPFVIDPAFTTIFMEFDPEPALCQTVSFEQKEGLSNCTWTSCREGCTREVYQCKQIRVNYRSARRSRPDSAPTNGNLQTPPQQQLRRPTNSNPKFISNIYHGGGSSSQLASSDLRRGSEHSGSSFNTPFNNLITNLNNNNGYNNLLNGNGFGGGVSVGGGAVINTYHSASIVGGIDGFRDVSSSKFSMSSHFKNLVSALHHPSKHAVHAGGGGVEPDMVGIEGGDRTTTSLLSHLSSASAVRSSGGVGSGGGGVMNLKSNKHSRMGQQRTAKMQQPPTGHGSGEEPFWDYTRAHLFPNVKGCGYPPVIVCSDFVEKFGKEGTNFSCYYSKVDRALVVTSYDMSRVIMDLVYSMAIPIPSFIISVVYLIFAYFRIYNTEASSATHETGGGGRTERLNSSSTTTNLQNPGSANRGGGGSSADDPDAELSVDDKTCIIQRSTSRGLNAISDKLPNSGKGLHAQVIEMNDLNPTSKMDLNPQLRHPVDGDVFLPQKRNNNCSSNPVNPERNGPTNPAAKNKGEEEASATAAAPAVEAS